MKRSEAVELLKDILEACREQIVIDMIYLRQTQQPTQASENEGYQVVMKANIDKSLRDCLGPITKKHGVNMKEEKGCFIFFTS
jgi:hypothetical protein